MQVRTRPDVLPAAAVARAVATFAGQLAARHTEWLLHFDAHYLNVLRTLDDTGWRLIDPLPHAGPMEWEPIALLRNRFSDAAATGDPDRALQRRLDILVDALSLDRELAVDLAQATAVDNLLWLLPHHPDHVFVEPYRLILDW